MQVQLESTDKVVDLMINGAAVPARIWEGVTASGIRCHAYITRIAAHKDQDLNEFERELQEQRPPGAAESPRREPCGPAGPPPT